MPQEGSLSFTFRNYAVHFFELDTFTSGSAVSHCCLILPGPPENNPSGRSNLPILRPRSQDTCKACSILYVTICINKLPGLTGIELYLPRFSPCKRIHRLNSSSSCSITDLGFRYRLRHCTDTTSKSENTSSCHSNSLRSKHHDSSHSNVSRMMVREELFSILEATVTHHSSQPGLASATGRHQERLPPSQGKVPT